MRFMNMYLLAVFLVALIGEIFVFVLSSLTVGSYYGVMETNQYWNPNVWYWSYPGMFATKMLVVTVIVLLFSYFSRIYAGNLWIASSIVVGTLLLLFVVWQDATNDIQVAFRVGFF